MRTGWAWYSGSWYYLKSSGAMATGWVQDGGKWYFLDADGRMLKGFIHDGKAWYYLDSSGAWVEHYTDAEVTSGGQKIRIVNGIAYVDGDPHRQQEISASQRLCAGAAGGRRADSTCRDAGGCQKGRPEPLCGVGVPFLRLSGAAL